MGDDEFFRELQEFEYQLRQHAKGKLEDLIGDAAKHFTDDQIKSIQLTDEEIEEIVNEDLDGEYER